jgi:hypothetical protein
MEKKSKKYVVTTIDKVIKGPIMLPLLVWM